MRVNSLEIKQVEEEKKEICCIRNEKGKAVSVMDVIVCECIKSDYYIFVLSGTPYIYDEGKYIADINGSLTKTIIKSYLADELIKSTTISRIYNLILSDYGLQVTEAELNNYPDDWIAFQDGLYDLKNNVLHEYKPELRVVNRIPHEYLKVCCATEGVETEKFLSFALSEEDRKTILEFLGYCMTKSNKYQKFLLLKGSRGTGKSVLLSLLEKIVGSENISNLPLQSLEEKFHSIQLLHKLVNICSDISALPLKSTNSIKLITGGDMLTDSYKGKDLLSFRPYAKLVFSCNSIPLVLDGDSSNAFYKRIIIICMDNPPKTIDRELKSKLENEILYLINISLKAYKRTLNEGEIYESSNTKRMIEELYSESDSLQGFLDMCVINDPMEKVAKSQLYKEYLNYCENEGREPLAKHTFNRRMKNKGFAEYKSGVDSWKGLILKDWEKITPF